MKLLKSFITIAIILLISIWLSFTWLLLVDPWSDLTRALLSMFPTSIVEFIDSTTGYTTTQISFLITILLILIYFYRCGYKDAKEKYDITKNINQDNY